MANIFQQQITPRKPRVLAQERIFVYVPKASNTTAGIASFEQRDFAVNNGQVTLRWPFEMIIETLADPIAQPSMTKVLSDEFVHTNDPVTITNPTTGVTYTSDTAEVKFNRDDRDAFARPDFVQLDDVHDFEIDPLQQQPGPDGEIYNKYTLKRNNPLVEPSLVQLDNEDFDYPANKIVDIRWPMANNPAVGSQNTNGFGLMRIKPGSIGNLKFDAQGDLEVDMDKVMGDMTDYTGIRPTYGANASTGFLDYSTYVDAAGMAMRQSNGTNLLKITKDAVGLSEVENKHFSDYVFTDLSQDIRDNIQLMMADKLDVSIWDDMFADWNPPTTDRNTPQRWLTVLDNEDTSIWESIRSLRLFLGIFDTVANLNALYPPEAEWFGSTAYVLQSNSYWAMRPASGSTYQFMVRGTVALNAITGQTVGDIAVDLDNGNEYEWNGSIWSLLPTRQAWEWYDTLVENMSFMNFIETDGSVFRPDGTGAAGTSGKWAQSDHVHPSDPDKLDTEIYQDTNVTVTTVAPTTPNDFKFRFWDMVDDTTGNATNADFTVDDSTELSTITGMVANDIAATRDTGDLYEYDGSTWDPIPGSAIWPQIPATQPNRNITLNIPYVRTAQYLHNWQGSETAFTIPKNEYYWAGDAFDYAALNLANIPNGALMAVDDGESLEPGSFLNQTQIENLGIKVGAGQTNRFVTTDTTNDFDGLPLTIETDAPNNERKIAPIILDQPGVAMSNPMVVVVPLPNGNTIKEKYFTPGRLLEIDAEGTPQNSDIIADNILLSDAGTTPVALTPNRLLRSAANQVIIPFATGTIANRLLASDGNNDVQVITLTPGRILESAADGSIDVAPYIADNIVKTGTTTTPVNLTTGRVAMTGAGNTLTVFDALTIAERPIVSDGANSIKVKGDLTPARLMLTDVNGGLSTFTMTAGDAGNYVAVSATGTPVLTPAPAHLPVTLIAANAANPIADSLVIWRGTSDPGTYNTGVLYMW